MKNIVLILYLFLGTKLTAQVNLVPNYSFEEYSVCPVGPGDLYKTNYWFNPNLATPDYFNSCSSLFFASTPTNYIGYQVAYGNSYAGIGIHITAQPSYLHEYISVKLVNPLETNKKYCINFLVSLANYSKAYISSLGVLLTDTMYTYPVANSLPFVPQLINPPNNFLSDTLTWKLLEFEYTGTGIEKFITIGCFEDVPALNYYYFNQNDTANAFAYYYIDNIHLELCENAIVIPNIFTPNDDGINDVFYIKSLQPNTAMNIYNRWGSIVYSSTNYQNNWNGENNSEGVYYYIVQLPFGTTKKGTVTLLR